MAVHISDEYDLTIEGSYFATKRKLMLASNISQNVISAHVAVNINEMLRAIGHLKSTGDDYESTGSIHVRLKSALLSVADFSTKIKSVQLDSTTTMYDLAARLNLPTHSSYVNLAGVDLLVNVYQNFVLTWFLKHVPSTAILELHRIMRLCHLLDYTNTWDQFIAKSKALTLLCKKYQDTLSPWWRYMIDLDLVAAYQVKKIIPSISEVYRWLCVPKYHGSLYMHLFQAEIDEVLSSLQIVAPMQFYSAIDFVSHPYLWATSGSSMRAIKKNGLKKNKWALAYNTKLDVLLSYLNTPHRNILRPFIKPDEPVKSRYIATADDPCNLKQCFLDLYVLPTIKNMNITPLYMSDLQYLQMCHTLIETMDSGYINMDLDQHEFDHYPLAEMVIAVIHFLNVIAYKASNENDEVARISFALLRDYEDMYVQIDDNYFKWRSGVASGWRWTALLDTLINYFECRVVDRLYYNIYGKSTLLCRFVQGDDATERYSDPLEPHIRLLMWEKLGFDIAKNKTLIGTRCSEFLRYSFGERSMRPYPSRMLHTLFTAFSEDEDKLVAERSTVINYLLYCARANIEPSKANLIPRWRPLLNTSTVFSGFGIAPRINTLSFVPRIPKYNKTVTFYGFELQRMGKKYSMIISHSRFYTVQKTLTLRPYMLHPIPLRAIYIDADSPYRVVEDFIQVKDQIIQLIPLLTEESKVYWQSMYSNLTRRMQILWLLGRLPLPTSYVLSNPRAVSYVVDRYAQRILGTAVEHKITYNHWIGYMLWLEDMLPTLIKDVVHYTLVP